LNIRKIAELAGVSVATVSRVFNLPERVLPETRERVLAVTREHNFTPNWFARGLTLGATKTIALLIPAIDSYLSQNIISGVETVAGNNGYVVLFCQTHGDQEVEFDFLKLMKTRKVDGIIQVQSQLSETDFHEPLSLNMPRVHIGKNQDCGCHMVCYLDYEEAAFRLVKHLLTLGHRYISLLYDDKRDGELADEMESGLKRAGREVQCEAHLSIFRAEDSAQGGYRAFQRMVQKGTIPDVLVTAGDLQAIGILKAARDGHISIPEDMALACFNDSPVCSVVSPAITSVEMPAAKLGMAAARLLFDSIEDDTRDPDILQEMILQPKLKIRESCGNKTGIFELFV
jgi:LacI family transcriptional regulator